MAFVIMLKQNKDNHMYRKNDKRRLYWLIDEYILGKINESTFCDEYYYSYDLEIDNSTFTHNEKYIFSELSKVTSRFSQYEEDHILDSKAFSSIDELRQKVLETRDKLKGENLF
ncbi:magnesium and cobalt transport protein CorA [Flavobacterium circumlabens]|uniref:Magnesium and cobalt transport protein CorA n=1 Tax=Flavobacterium circumlabens TaxID=2133765 RepID=A0A4Y7UI04_9FLAO|nr:magnesium and cobalt transport protein CorA [Flavobacterium circumlabens]TCN60928.1 hypothetical protein EV142_101507 [Flavobacterium circumlabens]TEB46047.1 magnesium and cobalt transport protein CorA [Flavobacterium circumlabens]